LEALLALALVASAALSLYTWSRTQGSIAARLRPHAALMGFLASISLSALYSIMQGTAFSAVFRSTAPYLILALGIPASAFAFRKREQDILLACAL
jgi:hypothetical protein